LTASLPAADDRAVRAVASLRSTRPVWTAAALLAAALVAWIVSVERMRGMDAGPGTDLGGLAWFLGVWVTMTAAMMLPSAAPMVLTYARVARESRAWIFVGGYLVAWIAYGLAAYALYRLVAGASPGWLAWDRDGPYVAGAAIVVAGLYQLSPLKEACLRHCRGPFHYVVHGWREGRVGALRMGAEHGLYCVGCCWGLMLALFALGVMSLFWTAVVAAAIFAEKVLPHGLGLARVLAAGLVVLGLWVALAATTVPGLTDPARAPAMKMGP
jgi:predicted metal-binding membrane protein